MSVRYATPVSGILAMMLASTPLVAKPLTIDNADLNGDSWPDLFDVNSDGLPDVVVTQPGTFGGKHGLFLNGSGGRADAFGATTMGVAGVLGADASTITLRNQNIQASDVDGDGTIDLLHMPRVRSYAVYTPCGPGSRNPACPRPSLGVCVPVPGSGRHRA